MGSTLHYVTTDELKAVMSDIRKNEFAGKMIQREDRPIHIDVV